MSKKEKSKKSSKSSKRKAPGPFTAAGLVRFYEEADVGIKMKPYILIILISIFTILVIVFSKIYGT